MDIRNVFLLNVCNETTPNVNPMNMLPVSPRKMLAGLKLYRKKPRHAPMKPRSSNTSPGLCCISKIPHSPTAEMIARPDARPSSPSIRLKALMIATSQITTSAQSTGAGRLYPSSNPNRVPENHIISAAATCPPSLINGLIPRTSSITPTTSRTSDAMANFCHHSKSSAPASMGPEIKTATRHAA